MTPETIVQEFRKKVCEQVRLVSEGLDRYVVFTPFMFDDGDHLCILLKRQGDRWYLTDEGHTFMHVSYDEIDIEKGTRLYLPFLMMTNAEMQPLPVSSTRDLGVLSLRQPFLKTKRRPIVRFLLGSVMFVKNSFLLWNRRRSGSRFTGKASLMNKKCKNSQSRRSKT